MKRKKRIDACRIKLTLEDIAYLLGISESALRKRIQRGTFALTGEPITDFQTLHSLLKDK